MQAQSDDDRTTCETNTLPVVHKKTFLHN